MSGQRITGDVGSVDLSYLGRGDRAAVAPVDDGRVVVGFYGADGNPVQPVRFTADEWAAFFAAGNKALGREPAPCTMTDPARVLPAPVILIDHAEQLPWIPIVYIKGESWLLPTERAHLGTGDYAIKDLLPYFRIERKAEDLYSTLFGRGPNTALGEANPNQDRFRRELDRMNDPEVSGLVPGAFVRLWIEGTVYDLFARTGPHHGAFASKQPWELWNLLASIEVDYSMPVAFVGRPAAGGLRLGTAALRVWNQATDPKAVKKAEKRGLAAGLPWLGALIGKGGEAAPPVGCSWCAPDEVCNMCGRNGGVVT